MAKSMYGFQVVYPNGATAISLGIFTSLDGVRDFLRDQRKAVQIDEEFPNAYTDGKMNYEILFLTVVK